MSLFVKDNNEHLKNYLKNYKFKKLYSNLKYFKEQLKKETYIDGIANSIEENLYNYIGYLHN